MTVAVADRADGTDGVTGARVHYDADEEGRARLDHFVVGDEYSAFEIRDLRCVPVAERAITVVPGVESVEPAGETVGAAIGRGRGATTEG